MVRINNKIESYNFIRKKGLNTLGEKVFYSHQKDEIKDFIDNLDVHYYLIRDKARSSGIVRYNVLKEEVLSYVDEYEILSIEAAMSNYRDNKILVGDILITSDYEVELSATSNKDGIHRLMLPPNYFLRTDILDRKLKHIPGMAKLLDYIFKHELINIIIEFGVFDKKIGTENEYVVVFEARTHY